MASDSLQHLVDLREIQELKARYCRLLDAKAWGELTGLFTADAVFAGFSSVPVGSPPDAFVAAVAKRVATAATIHRVQAPEIAILGDDRARGTWSMMDYVDLSPDGARSADPAGRGWVGWGSYWEEYVRAGGQWRISSMRLVRQRMDALKPDHPASAMGSAAPGTAWLQGAEGAGGR